jgi:hypothetical protein
MKFANMVAASNKLADLLPMSSHFFSYPQTFSSFVVLESNSASIRLEAAPSSSIIHQQQLH